MRHPLRHFILRTLVFAAAFAAILAAAYLLTDPLKTLRWYPEYYADREQVNAGVVTLANFDHYAPEERFDALILGNSLSQYCYIADWREAIGGEPFRSAYHLASSSQTVPTTRRFLRHALERGDTVRQILIAFDVYALSDSTAGLHEYYDTDPPALFRGPMRLAAHAFHGAHAMSRGVLAGWAARALTGRFPDQGHNYPRWLQNVDYDPRHNEIYWTETEAWLDTASFQAVAGGQDGRLARASGRRNHPAQEMLSVENARVVADLNAIRALLDASGADWRLVILPNSDGALVAAADDSTLRAIFGAGYVNMDTAAEAERRDPRNFLDLGHPRPRVMRKILRQAYR